MFDDLLAKKLVCAVCGKRDFVRDKGFVNLPVSTSVNQFQLNGKHLPCVALVCNHCGHTHFFNVNVWKKNYASEIVLNPETHK